MPYINIREQDIQTVSNFDTVENTVLIFGPDFHLSGKNVFAKKKDKKETFDYRLYTSVVDFNTDINIGNLTKLDGAVYRPYVTAYDCLLNGLPVMYVPIDDFIDSEAMITIVDSEGEHKYVEYNLLDVDIEANSSIYDPSRWTDNEYRNSIWYTGSDSKLSKENAIALYNSKAFRKALLNNPMENALNKLLKEAVDPDTSLTKYPLSDRVNFPITFITTCGYEHYQKFDIETGIKTLLKDESLSTSGAGRLDVLYLYDLPYEVTKYTKKEGTEDKYDEVIVPLTPQNISDPLFNSDAPTDVGSFPSSLVDGEASCIVYPWGHYNVYRGPASLHMPGSYGFLMAYANSIKNNRPWLATAGVNRGFIPNIVNLDYKIRESYIHLWQGDVTGGNAWSKTIKINPIIDLGSNYGKVIFGNRTCASVPENQDSFRKYLNVRMLLIKIHKQVFLASLTHMFEPNDDLVWLSFKQQTNLLLDEMVSGRGLKWYKWKRIRTDKLGLIRAQLTIRPIEAVEAFDILIAMTDSDIEVQEG